MKQCLPRAVMTWTMILVSVLASSTSIAAPEIDDDEYAVYGAALGNLAGVFDIPARSRVVFDTTLSSHRLDAGSIAHLARSGMAPDLVMIEDFNRKNASRSRLAAGRIPPPFTLSDNWTPDFPSDGGVERLELSRVGFDGERRRALVVISYTFRGSQRAFHGNGGYMMLQKQDNRWRVMGMAAGWASYY